MLIRIVSYTIGGLATFGFVVMTALANSPGPHGAALIFKAGVITLAVLGLVSFTGRSS